MGRSDVLWKGCLQTREVVTLTQGGIKQLPSLLTQCLKRCGLKELEGSKEQKLYTRLVYLLPNLKRNKTYGRWVVGTYCLTAQFLKMYV